MLNPKHPSLSSSQASLLNQMLKRLDTIAIEPFTKEEPSTFPYCKLLKESSSPLNGIVENLPKDILNSVIQPTVISYNKSIGTNTQIVVIATAFINTSTSLNSNNFVVNYDFSLNVNGIPQLNIYISFDKNIEGEDYDYYAFEIGLDSDSMFTDQMQLNGVETVQVYLYDTDPKTSRGTVTTVQSGTSGG